MPMKISMKAWVAAVEEFVQDRVRAIVGGFSGKTAIEPPLTVEAMEKLRGTLPLPLPGSLMEFWLPGSRACRFEYQWDLSGMPAELLEQADLDTDGVHGGAALSDVDELGKWVSESRE